jgi:enoyl-CoA hydratase
VPSSVRIHQENDRVARLELVQPDGFPRLTLVVLDELAEKLSRLLADATCSGLVIHGTDKCFAAGAEINEVSALSGVTALDYARRTQLLFQKINQAPKPVVAAITGFCLGGGFDLALACHWRLATPEVVFGHPGVTLGLMTGWGGTQRLPRLLGRSVAIDLLLAGRQVGAEEAFARGLVDEILSGEALLPRACRRAAAAGKTKLHT